MACLEPHLANGRVRPQPPDPTKYVLHLLVLTSALAQALSMLTHTSVHLQEKQVFLSLPSPSRLTLCASLWDIHCHKTSKSHSPDLPARELSDPGSEPCCSFSPQQGLILCEEQKPGGLSSGTLRSQDISTLASDQN